MYLSDEAIENYLQPLDPAQVEIITLLRGLILESGQGLDERIETGKWYTGLLVYDAPGRLTTYALGPRSGGYTTFHMMPLYGSPVLQERHGATLKPILSGKSCIKVRSIEQIPLAAVRDIIAAGPRYIGIAGQLLAERTSKSKPRGYGRDSNRRTLA